MENSSTKKSNNQLVNYSNSISSNYFNEVIIEEEIPIICDTEIQEKYSNLDKLYENFFAGINVHKAKYVSKKEREEKELIDSSFIYGEIVSKCLIIE